MATKSFDLHAEFGTDVTVLRVEIRERALSAFRRFYGHEEMKGPKKAGMHDYIIFTATDTTHKPFSFVVEKLKNWTHCCGMPSHIQMVPLSEHTSAALPSRSRFVWELHNHWTVSTTELNTILTTTGHHYNLLSANCWSYAANTVENVLGLWLCHSLQMRNFKALGGCLEALEQLEMVKRPLPQDVFRLFSEPFSHGSRDTFRRITNWCNRRSVKVASPCARNGDINCDSVEAVLNLWLRHSQISIANCHTVEAVLYLCLRHSLRMDDLELARGCEEALQQLEAVKRPLLRYTLRLVYKPLSHQNPDTLRKISDWCTRPPVNLASSSIARNDGPVQAIISVLNLHTLYLQVMHDLELARGWEEALQQLGTLKRPLLLYVLQHVREFIDPVVIALGFGDTSLTSCLWSRRSGKSGPYHTRRCDILEAMLYLYLRHSLRMDDLELARGCEEALQQLETVKRPLPRDVHRFVFKPLQHQNYDTSRRSASGGIAVLLNCIWRHPAPENVTQTYPKV